LNDGAEVVNGLEATVAGKADQGQVTQSFLTLANATWQGLARLQGDMDQKADAARTVQHLNTLRQQINRNMDNLQAALRGKADHAGMMQHFNTLRQHINQSLNQLQGDIDRKADAGRVAQQINALVNQLNQNLGALQAAIHGKTDQAYVAQQVNALTAQMRQRYQVLYDYIIRNQGAIVNIGLQMQQTQATVATLQPQINQNQAAITGMTQQVNQNQAAITQMQAQAQNAPTAAQFNTLAQQVTNLQQMMTQLMTQTIPVLRTENQQLRQQLAAERRHSARIEVRANLTRLSNGQTSQAIQRFLNTNPDLAQHPNLVRDQHGNVTHIRGFLGQRHVTVALQHAFGDGDGTLREVHDFLARMLGAPPDRTRLENTIFTLLGIAEPQ
jgi:predicted  nucleic acid-binding Zn-ribbon protein